MLSSSYFNIQLPNDKILNNEGLNLLTLRCLGTLAAFAGVIRSATTPCCAISSVVILLLMTEPCLVPVPLRLENVATRSERPGLYCGHPLRALRFLSS